MERATRLHVTESSLQSLRVRPPLVPAPAIDFTTELVNNPSQPRRSS